MNSQETTRSASQPADRPFSPNDPLLNPDQASAYFGGAPTPTTLERYRREGIGPNFVKLAGRILYRQSALDAFVDQCTREMKPRNPLRKRRSGAA